MEKSFMQASPDLRSPAAIRQLGTISPAEECLSIQRSHRQGICPRERVQKNLCRTFLQPSSDPIEQWAEITL